MEDKEFKKRVDDNFKKWAALLNKLPLPIEEKAVKILTLFNVYYFKFLLSEDGNTTKGIKTEWQLKRANEELEKRHKDLLRMSIEKWAVDLNNIEPLKAVEKIDKQLFELRNKELLAEIGGEGFNDWQKWLKKFLPIHLDNQQKRLARKPPKLPKKTSYVWQGNQDKELPELHSLMIDKYKLIAPETTYEQFKAIFTGQPIESIEPIKWHQDNASELLYFIDKLEQSGNIANKSKRADYIKMTACFVKPDGNQFEAAWKSLKTNLEINLSPDKQKAIDELVKNF